MDKAETQSQRNMVLQTNIENSTDKTGLNWISYIRDNIRKGGNHLILVYCSIIWLFDIYSYLLLNLLFNNVNFPLQINPQVFNRVKKSRTSRTLHQTNVFETHIQMIIISSTNVMEYSRAQRFGILKYGSMCAFKNYCFWIVIWTPSTNITPLTYWRLELWRWGNVCSIRLNYRG